MTWVSLLIALTMLAAWWFTREFRKGYELWLKEKYGGLTYAFSLLAWALSPLLILAGLVGVNVWSLVVGIVGFVVLSGGFLFEMWRFIKFSRAARQPR